MTRPTPTRALSILAGLWSIGTVGSWYTLRQMAPAQQHVWGYLLAALLGLWATASLWVLLPSVATPARRAAAAVLLLALGGGAINPESGWYALRLLLPVALGLLLLAVLLLGAGHLAGRHAPAWPLLLGFVPLLASVLAVGSASALHTGPAVPPTRLGVSSELRYMLSMDQRDRETGRAVLNVERETARLRLVRDFDARGLLVAPEDQYRAAQIFQHSACPAENQRAYELAHSAALAGLEDAEPLQRAAYERWTLATAQPQPSAGCAAP